MIADNHGSAGSRHPWEASAFHLERAMRSFNERMSPYTFPPPFGEDVIADMTMAAKLNALRKIQVSWERVGDGKSIGVWTLTTSPKGARILDPLHVPSPTALRACKPRVIVFWKDRTAAIPHMRIAWSSCEPPDVKRIIGVVLDVPSGARPGRIVAGSAMYSLSRFEFGGKGIRRFTNVSFVPTRMGRDRMVATEVRVETRSRKAA